MSARHGHTSNGNWSREYRSYRTMLTRCYDVQSGSYERYGGRGVVVHDAWLASFAAFLADVGSAPGPKHQLDRINADGNYEPGNVRWVTAQENNDARRNRRWVDLDGKRVLLAQACREHGQNQKVVESRLRLGWSIVEALRTANDGTHRSRDPVVRLLQAEAQRCGVNWSVVRKRLFRGWATARAFL